ncbi:MAG TPA: capsular biosynthesis protein [Alphaproteobacteria bacterium]|jgi:capsular polysaccharide export protein|nr:capsular biosynthesis protein [Alphaproteobacteria bacterium]
MSNQRSFLFLQGMATQFFAKLGAALAKKGHDVHRINFNGGDKLFWLRSGAVDFRGDLKAWPQFLEQRLAEWGVTDIILFGDCRPLHKEAVRVASLRGIQVFVVDEGYIRPNWVTMELGGVNGNSPLPRDPDWYRNAAKATPAWSGGLPAPGSFQRRAVEDVIYNVASVGLGWRFPGYKTHRPWHPFYEYGGWLKRFARKPSAKRRSARSLKDVMASEKPFYLFPLQLDCDSQIRQHSPFGRIKPSIEYVIRSFAQHAPADTQLVIKEHPLDNCLTDWRSLVTEVAVATGMQDRVVYVEGGDLEAMLTKSISVVTVNSTVGLIALARGLAVKTLGDAVYDMPELTFQPSLDRFWTEATTPDATLFDCFRRVVAARTQVNGGFFSKIGLELAVAGSVAALENSERARKVSTVAVHAENAVMAENLDSASLAV